MFYMTEEMSVKYLLGVYFWTVLLRDVIRNSIIFMKIVNDFLVFTIFEKKSHDRS